MKLPVGHVPGLGVHKATAYGGLGEKLLRGWGWEKGQGLGKDKQGISAAIEVKKKDDNTGIGGSNRYQWDEKWWEAAFNSNAQTIADAAGASGYESDSDSSDSDSDEEELRTCSAGLKRNRDGTLASGSAAELAIAASVAKDARGWAGRFGGREGKMERIRRMEAEQAAAARRELGLPDEVAVAPSTPPKKKDSKDSKTKKAKADSDSEDNKPAKKEKKDEKKKKKKKKAKGEGKKAKENTGSEDSDEDAVGKASKKAKKEKNSKGADKSVAEQEETEAVPRHVFKPLPANWWGANYFVSAGAMVGLEQSEEAKKRQQFTEDSQEALYNRAQDSKVAGRQGLGVRGSKIKISGGDYQGKKIAFEDEDGGGGGSEGDDTAEDSAIDGIKWKKLIAKTLKGEESGSMKVKKLQKRVAAAAKKQLDSMVDPERLESIVLEKLKGSSKFVVEGKLARCS